MCVCVYIYIYIYPYVYIYTYTNMDLYIYIHIIMDIHIYIYRDIYTHCPDGSNLPELGKIEILPGTRFKYILNIFGVVIIGLERPAII